MTKELRREELTSIVYGSSFYGGGGGGSAEEGLALIEAMYAEDPSSVRCVEVRTADYRYRWKRPRCA